MASYYEPELTDDSDCIEDSFEANLSKNISDVVIKESFENSRKANPTVSSDSDEEPVLRKNSKKNLRVIESSESDEETSEIIESSPEGSLHSIQYVEDKEMPKKSASSRISSIDNFGMKGSIMNSTQIGETNNPSNSFHEQVTNVLVSSGTTSRKSTPRNQNLHWMPKNMLHENMMTPRTTKKDISSRSPSISEDDDDDDDVINITSDDDEPVIIAAQTPKLLGTVKKTLTQTTLDAVVVKGNVGAEHESPQDQRTLELHVSPSEFSTQKEKIHKIETDLLKAKNMLRTVNLKALPDKGKLLVDREVHLQKMLIAEQNKLERMNISKEDPKSVKGLVWEDIVATVATVQPKTFGKQAMATYNNQKALTVDRLHQLHGSLEKCPKEDILADDPKGLRVELMPHQKRALAWLLYREGETPSGGILADDMGLGKTLTMISLALKSNEAASHDSDEENDEYNNTRKKFNGGTLIVCPASLLNQWTGEIESKCKRGLLSYITYHGPKREKKAKVLSEYDMVITTYSIIQHEQEHGTVFRVNWRRIILDEAHQIRNHKSRTAMAVFDLSAKSRWALTGTPIHNKELDMFSLLKFLRCSPFDDLQVWKRWVGDKSTGGIDRLHTVISSLMLRRTKAELMEKGSLNCLPARKWEVINITLENREQEIYHRVNLFSRTLFAQYLHQRAVKNQDIYDANYATTNNPNGPNSEYFKMRDKLLKMNKLQDVSQHHILVLLLRLRQLCCHPSLITAMLDETDGEVDSGDEMTELNLLDQLNNLNLDDDEFNPSTLDPESEGKATLKEVSKGLLNASNPIFAKNYLSTKIKVTLEILKERALSKGDKAILVSQFPSYLRIIGSFLKNERIYFDQLDGSVPVIKRMEMVDNFNDPSHKMQVLLLSLTAGGVGLNLIGANHLFLVDLHWNPQLETQAQDRIYRVGQQKPVFVYKLIALDTIEERIKQLQDSKLSCAEAMLTGTKQVTASKLSLEDLKMLFSL